MARIEPAQLVLPRAEGHLCEFRPKEYRPHGIVPAVGGGEEVLDGFADLADKAEFSPEFFTDLTHQITARQSVDIAPWITQNPDMGHKLSQLHGWLGDAIMCLAGLHASAALFHHYVLHDNVLRSMLRGHDVRMH